MTHTLMITSTVLAAIFTTAITKRFKQVVWEESKKTEWKLRIKRFTKYKKRFIKRRKLLRRRQRKELNSEHR